MQRACVLFELLAGNCLLGSLNDVCCGQAVLLTQEALRANLAEAILNADHLHRNRAVLDNNIGNRRTKAALDLMVLGGYGLHRTPWQSR